MVRGVRSREHGRSLAALDGEGEDVHILRKSPNHRRNSLAEQFLVVGPGLVPASAAEKGHTGEKRDERPCPRRTETPAQMYSVEVLAETNSVEALAEMNSVEAPVEMNSVEVPVHEDLLLAPDAELAVPGSHHLRGSSPCHLLDRVCCTLHLL